jgi:hypothetical protein
MGVTMMKDLAALIGLKARAWTPVEIIAKMDHNLILVVQCRHKLSNRALAPSSNNNPSSRRVCRSKYSKNVLSGDQQVGSKQKLLALSEPVGKTRFLDSTFM